ncbi:alpha/beta hydrolase [Demequina aestuarii]|uniref:alpha/beta hydrolase n=1 Tax=Demequina aestuarii TaxID=327095 RepID=UPI000781E079|nr:alpha/beta hydrolase-fold protein [Demequina aestuarii]
MSTLGVTRRAWSATVVMAAVALAGCGDTGDAVATSSATPEATHAQSTVFQFDSEELAGNLLGASTEITVGVLLPDAYFTSDDPLPVLYFLPGYSASSTAADMPDVLGEALNETEPMIVVTVTGANELGGSWYTDSEAIGNWEQAVVTEIVPYVDTHYRTRASAESRGLAGHSMGGYGALTIGMRHADVFGSVLVMAPAVAGEDGLGDLALLGSASDAPPVLLAMEALEGLEGEALLSALSASAARFALSYGTAFAPSPEPPYFQYPYSLVDGEVVRDDTVWEQWEAGIGDIDVDIAQHREALLSLETLGLDCGSNDEFTWIVEGCDFIDAELTAQGVPHTYTVHDGTHTSLFRERMTDAVLPFFAEAFAGRS